MTDLIDHAAEAHERLDWINDEYTREPHVHQNVMAYAAVAQVHATLALVDAQREATEVARIQIMLNLPGSPEQIREAPADDRGRELAERILKGLGL